MQLKSRIRYHSPRRRRAAVEDHAQALIAAHGGMAHVVARSRARGDRLRGAPKNPLWHAVARRIATLAAQ